MNLHQLRVFYEVVRLGKISSAAERLHLTQPAVTWQIKSLENSFNLKFLDRIGKKILPTEEGKVLLEFAERFLNLERQAEEALDDVKNLSKGNLRIGASFTFGDFYLPPLLLAFHRKYPQIRLQISAGNSIQIIEDLLAYKIDLGIVASEPKEEKLETQQLTSDLLVAVVAPAHAWAKRKFISLKELNGQPLLLREKGSSRRLVEEILAARGIAPQIIMESASTSAIKKMAESGVGIAILSQQVVQNEVQEGVLKKLFFKDAQIAYRFYLLYHRERHLSRAMKAFMELALEYFHNSGQTPRRIIRNRFI